MPAWTGFLMAAVLRHRAGEGGAFTRRYRAHRLVYYHSLRNVGNAIARETEIKKWRREKKVGTDSCGESDLGGLGGGVGEAAVMRVGRFIRNELSPSGQNETDCTGTVLPHLRQYDSNDSVRYTG
jgi:hypothetical protein